MLESSKPVSESTLAYNQWGLSHSPKGNFTRYAQSVYIWYGFENYLLTAAYTRDIWINSCIAGMSRDILSLNNTVFLIAKNNFNNHE